MAGFHANHSPTISNNTCTPDYTNCSGPISMGMMFCDDYSALPYVYLACSLLSALCCVIVFLTYFLIPRLSGYSSNVFLYRTMLDFIIAIAHIVAVAAGFVGQKQTAHVVGCELVGCVFEFSLFAANLWYAVLAYDLTKAIRNPFGSRPSSGWQSHTIVWGTSLGAVILLVVSKVWRVGPGPSMFYICWISVEKSSILDFALTSLVLYYLPHCLLLLFSVLVIIRTVFLLFRRLPASSETRKHILKQNCIYVVVLGLESIVIIPLWIIELVISANSNPDRFCFFSIASLALSFVFAVVHSLRGTVDLIVWWVTFTIGPKDFHYFIQHLKLKFKRDLYIPETTLHTPLVNQPDSRVNKVLRKDVIYCINVGILDAVRQTADEEKQRVRLGSVRDTLIAHMMVKWEEHNQQQEAEERHANPSYQEVHQRKIQFQPSEGQRDFAFIDIEPTVFGLLRNSYGLSPAVYQESFQLNDLENSEMLEKFTEGKSGSFFYFTRDFRYIIKTVSSEEEAFLQKIAYRYYSYMQKNPDSLIVRLYGLHKVRLAREQRYISVVVMDNIFYNSESLQMQERYDLKGSKVGRRVLRGNEKADARFKKTLKDLDMTSRVVIGPDSKTQLMEQLQSDVDFLASLKIMDYSLLLGIHHHRADGSFHRRSTPVEIGGGDNFTMVDPVQYHSDTPDSINSTPSSTLERGYILATRGYRNGRFHSIDKEMEESANMEEEDVDYNDVYDPWHRRDYGGIRSYSPKHPLNREGSSTRQEVAADTCKVMDSPVDTYFFGIVDILQEYNFSKKLEHFFKTRVLCKDRHQISAVNEKEYAARFLNAMDRIFE